MDLKIMNATPKNGFKYKWNRQWSVSVYVRNFTFRNTMDEIMINNNSIVSKPL